MMPTYLKTPGAADALGLTVHQLTSLIRYRRIPLPGKDSSGDYIWADDDLAAVRNVLKARKAKAALAK